MLGGANTNHPADVDVVAVAVQPTDHAGEIHDQAVRTVKHESLVFDAGIGRQRHRDRAAIGVDSEIDQIAVRQIRRRRILPRWLVSAGLHHPKCEQTDGGGRQRQFPLLVHRILSSNSSATRLFFTSR